MRSGYYTIVLHAGYIGLYFHAGHKKVVCLKFGLHRTLRLDARLTLMVVAVYRSRISIATFYYYFYFLIKESNILGRHSKYEFIRL